jgi:hypothetical protein
MRALVRWAAAATGTRRRLGAVHLEALERLVSKARGEVELPAGPGARRVAIVREDRLEFEVRPRERSLTKPFDGAA